MKITIELDEKIFEQAAMQAVNELLCHPSSRWVKGGDAYEQIKRQVAESIKKIEFSPLIESMIKSRLSKTIDRLVQNELDKQVKKAVKQVELPFPNEELIIEDSNHENSE